MRVVHLEIPAISRITTDAHAIPNAAGKYEIVPTMEALFFSPEEGIILLLSIFSGNKQQSLLA